MKCENCNEIIKEKYGSGRFCSCKCARSFSTKKKRLEINQKVSQKIKGRKWKRSEIIARRKHEYEKRNCRKCNKKIEKLKKSNCWYCKNCMQFSRQDLDYRKNLSLKRIEAIKLGKVNFNSIKCKYIFKGKIIRCDSKVEYTCLDYFKKNYNVLDIKRCDFSIEYEYRNKIHRFLPDFIIKTNNQKYIVECKSFVSIKNLNEKWHFYNETSIIKKDALEKYCLNNNYKSFWYTKNLNLKFYNSLKNSELA